MLFHQPIAAAHRGYKKLSRMKKILLFGVLFLLIGSIVKGQTGSHKETELVEIPEGVKGCGVDLHWMQEEMGISEEEMLQNLENLNKKLNSVNTTKKKL